MEWSGCRSDGTEGRRGSETEAGHKGGMGPARTPVFIRRPPVVARREMSGCENSQPENKREFSGHVQTVTAIRLVGACPRVASKARICTPYLSSRLRQHRSGWSPERSRGFGAASPSTPCYVLAHVAPARPRDPWLDGPHEARVSVVHHGGPQAAPPRARTTKHTRRQRTHTSVSRLLMIGLSESPRPCEAQAQVASPSRLSPSESDGGGYGGASVKGSAFGPRLSVVAQPSRARRCDTRSSATRPTAVDSAKP
jgi:hypothetical protein